MASFSNCQVLCLFDPLYSDPQQTSEVQGGLENPTLSLYIYKAMAILCFEQDLLRHIQNFIITSPYMFLVRSGTVSAITIYGHYDVHHVRLNEIVCSNFGHRLQCENQLPNLLRLF
jgi:hypothetical protein